MKPDIKYRFNSKYSEEKRSTAKNFSFNLEEVNSTIGPVVFKLFCGEKYIIHKGLTLGGSIFHIQKAFGYFFSYQHDKTIKDDRKKTQEVRAQKDEYYFYLYKYIKANLDKKFRVEILFTSQDPYEILVQEQLELNKSLRDKKCLNNNIQSYIPKINEKTGKHGTWITADQVKKFHSFVSKLSI